MKKVCDDSSCDFTIVDCFDECSVRRAFAGSVESVTVVDVS